MIFLMGGNGFVGSAFARLFASHDLDHVVITRENYEEYAGRACDIFINANGNSKKFMAERDPAWEFDASVNSVSKSLADFHATKYVHLSTGDVYPAQDSPDITLEEAQLDPTRMSRYGLHKYLAETLVRGTHGNWIVFRMGGFVGPSMKKNAVFDMLNDEPVWLDPRSELQFIKTDSAAKIVWDIARSDLSNEVFNLGASGTVHIGELHARIESKSEFKPNARRVRFELSLDKLESALDRRLPSSKDEVFDYLTSIER